MKLFIQLFILLLSLGILYPANAAEADKAPTITLNISNLPLPDVLVINPKSNRRCPFLTNLRYQRYSESNIAGKSSSVAYLS